MRIHGSERGAEFVLSSNARRLIMEGSDPNSLGGVEPVLA